MMSFKPLAGSDPADFLADPAVVGSAGRRWLRALAAAALRGASRVLARLAADLASAPAASPRSDPRLEFYAEAGAPEGALYVDGLLVGWVDGVSRL